MKDTFNQKKRKIGYSDDNKEWLKPKNATKSEKSIEFVSIYD